MNRKIYNSQRYFTIFDFLISHGQLLLRSGEDNTDGKNIDIIFFGVRYMQIPTSFSGVSISLIEKRTSLINYESIKLLLSSVENNLFEVKTSDESFYIGASYLKVYENELQFNETSLGVSTNKGREIEIAGSL